MIVIELRDVQLYAYHGIFEGEEKTGSPYIVNLSVSYDDKDATFDDINDTINYAELYSIIKNRMAIPTGLVEKVCDSIVRHIKHQYSFVKEIELSIYKLRAPIENFQGTVGVRMNRKFNG